LGEVNNSIPPVADAGEDQNITLPTSSVSLNGFGDDPDGGTVVYLWTQVNGPANAQLTGTTANSLTASNLVEGDYVFRLTVTDNDDETAFDEVTVSVAPEVSTDFSLRINTGGSEVNYNGETFVADVYFDTGRTLDRPQTGLPEPYQTFRYSRSQQLSYDIPIDDGEYTVNLHFAELWFGATAGGSGGVGSRVFDVTIEGQLVEDNLDVFAEVGADAMLIRAHTVTVTGGVLNIDFDSRDFVGGERHPTINAIEILSSNGGGFGKNDASQKILENDMTIYPNQVSDIAIVSFEKPTEIQQIYVFDITGRLIRTYDPSAIKNNKTYTIDVNLYQQGAYIVKMIDTKGVHFQKQMIVRKE